VNRVTHGWILRILRIPAGIGIQDTGYFGYLGIRVYEYTGIRLPPVYVYLYSIRILPPQ